MRTLSGLADVDGKSVDCIRCGFREITLNNLFTFLSFAFGQKFCYTKWILEMWCLWYVVSHVDVLRNDRIM